ncbi:RNA polymerase II-associated protein 1 [Sergentomyia squamirostris]
MFKRPKPSDSEKDILQFQNEYLSEKRKNTSFQPSAKCVRMDEKPDGAKKESIFAKMRKNEARKDETKDEIKKSPFVMGDIVERNPGSFPGDEYQKTSPEESFPRAEKIDINVQSKGRSIFAKLQDDKLKQTIQEDEPMNEEVYVPEFGGRSFILTGEESSSIHDENVKMLSQMTKEDIEKEREKIMKSLDPKILEFIKSKRKVEGSKPFTDSPKASTTSGSNQVEIPDLNILQTDERQNWLHFDQYEADKFKWMTEISTKIPKINPGQSFEARFDWKGILLPFVENDEKSADNRELYLHGDDPYRPGYTIQELFRLARSNVTQQRIQALNAIAGILRIHNQGFYDEISELPITKIFFLLRFALDDSTPSVCEAAARGLSALFYNEIDELLLDTVFETRLGIIQPTFERSEGESLEVNFSKMNIESSQLDEDMTNIEQLNDFHLAEVDLLKCFIRTNILKRIRFLLVNDQLPDTGIISLIRILIRICREGKTFVQEVQKNDEIVSCLIRKHLFLMNRLPENSGKVQSSILKLLRVIVSGENSWNFLKNFDIYPILQDYCYTRRDLNMDFIQLQIESYRLLRILLSFRNAEATLSDFLPALKMSLEWHYQFMSVTSGSSLLRQHASALVSLLNNSSFSWRTNMCSPTLDLCFRKWTTLYTQGKTQDLSQNILLTCCFELIARQPANLVSGFVKECFENFLTSTKYSSLWNDLMTTSPLTDTRRDRSKSFEALKNLGSVAFSKNSEEPQLQLPFNYPGMLLLSVLEVCRSFGKILDMKIDFHEHVEKYFQLICSSNLESSSNWYWRHEIRLLQALIESSMVLEKSLVIRISMKTIALLKGDENVQNIKKILEKIIFNVEYYDTSFTAVDLQAWFSTYWNFYSMTFESDQIILPSSLFSSSWSKDLLPKSWPLALLTIFLEQHTSERTQLHINPQIEDEILRASMGFLGLLEQNALLPVSPSEEFMYLMMPFLSLECRFIEGAIKELLRNRINSLFARCQNLELDIKLQAKHDFESLYTIFLNQFQSSSYGDDLFSAMVMVPLAQKYDPKWRKMIWSEHIAVLRFITCTENQLCGNSIDPYCEPTETDSSLLKLYHQAINSHCLRQGSIPYRIAQHHLQCLKVGTQRK